MSLLCFLPAVLLATYSTVYFVWPFSLGKKKYIRFALLYLLIVAVCFMINVFAAKQFLIFAQGYSITHADPSKGVGLAIVNTSHAMVIAGLALGIKLTKGWYIQHTENAILAKKKIATDLQLEKARVYPRFLFKSLEKIREGIVSHSGDSSKQILRISDLLSYILYDSNEEWIPLEVELEMLKNRIEIETANRSGQFDFQFKITGNPINRTIAPMSLFSFMEDFIKVIEQTKVSNAMRMEIQIGASIVHVQMQVHGPVSTANSDPPWNEIIIASSQMLESLHPGHFLVESVNEKQSLVFAMEVPIMYNEDSASSDPRIKEKRIIYEEL